MPSQPRGVEASAEEPAEPVYPNIEAFIEYAGPPEIEHAFAPIKEALHALKGPKAEHAKKIRLALQRAEELLQHLLSVRERLEAAKRKSKR